ncbi:MAG: UTP--glucose-1-phosphate uridylyltransferase [Chlamydiales bacterium]
MKSASEALFKRLTDLAQEEMVAYLDSLENPRVLAKQLEAIDLSLLQKQRQLIGESVGPHNTFCPLTRYKESCSSEDIAIGKEAVGRGEVALLVLAGGQASRLRSEKPKGCYPITSLQKKSLFQLLCEKVRAASKQQQRELQVAFMTSPSNHEETEHFFEEYKFFGLKPKQVTFFQQSTLPLLDDRGKLFLESSEQLAKGPNGNGGLYKAVVVSGLYEKWKKEGIQTVHVLPIDNPLPLPFDFGLMGFHKREENEITLVAGEKKDPLESAGNIVESGGKPAIIDYMELLQEKKSARDKEGRLLYHLSNLGIYCLSLSFIHQMHTTRLPLHVVKKAVPQWIGGKTITPKEPNGWKSEYFIFDVLPFAQRSGVVIFPREVTYAPLKNSHGEGSIGSVSASLMAFDHKVFAEVTGKKPERTAVFELSPQFYYPTKELQARWQGVELPGPTYIEE